MWRTVIALQPSCQQTTVVVSAPTPWVILGRYLLNFVNIGDMLLCVGFVFLEVSLPERDHIFARTGEPYMVPVMMRFASLY